MSDAPFRLRWFHTLVSPRTVAAVLEVGCGNGQLLELLARRFPRAQFVGIDRSPLQVRRAIARLAALPPAYRPFVHQLALEDAADELTGAPFKLVRPVRCVRTRTRRPQMTRADRHRITLLAADGEACG